MAIKQTKQLESLMQEAFDRKASFLYMIPNEPPVFRIKDKIERGQGGALTVEQVKDIATAAFGENDLKDIGSETGQLTTLCTLAGVVEGRMSVTRVSGDYVLTVRMLPAKLPDAELLKIPQAILKAAMMPKGLVIFTGQRVRARRPAYSAYLIILTPKGRAIFLLSNIRLVIIWPANRQ